MDFPFLRHMIMNGDPFRVAELLIVVGLAGAAMFALGFVAIRQGRLLLDMPTSKVRSAAQGYVELAGHARFLPGPEIRSPLSGRRCCWWEYRVERRKSWGEREGWFDHWAVLESGRSLELFTLVDETGECIVDADGARVVPGARRVWRGYHPRPASFPERTPWLAIGNYRYTERMVGYGDWLCVLGVFRSQTALRDDDESRDVSELMAEWKRYPRDLLWRFDANRDGQIDLAEWEAARRTALEEVRQTQVAHVVEPDLHVIGRTGDRRPFIISTRSQEALSRSYRWGGVAAIAGGIALGALVVLAVMVRSMPPSP